MARFATFWFDLVHIFTVLSILVRFGTASGCFDAVLDCFDTVYGCLNTVPNISLFPGNDN